MTEEDSRKKSFRSVINKNIQTIIKSALLGYYTSSRRPIKSKITLQELVDYEMNKSYKKTTEEEKFKKFISISEDIIKNIKIMFPFINLTGIDLSWTTEEIQNKVWEMFEQTHEVNLNDCPRLSEEKRKTGKKKKSDRDKFIEKKIEEAYRSVIGLNKKDKFRSEYFKALLITYKNIQFGNVNWDKMNDICKSYGNQIKENLAKDFPDIEQYYFSTYTKFADIVQYIKSLEKE